LEGKKIHRLSVLELMSSIVRMVIIMRIIVIAIHWGRGCCHCYCGEGLWENDRLLDRHTGGGKGAEKCAKGGKCLDNICLKSSKIHQSMTFMVMMCIAIVNHWICYAKSYGGMSTGNGKGVKGCVHVWIFQKHLNYDVVGVQSKALHVWSTGECSILGCKGRHVGLKIGLLTM